jgi:hypothetical protein
VVLGDRAVAAEADGHRLVAAVERDLHRVEVEDEVGLEDRAAGLVRVLGVELLELARG